MERPNVLYRSYTVRDSWGTLKCDNVLLCCSCRCPIGGHRRKVTEDRLQEERGERSWIGIVPVVSAAALGMLAILCKPSSTS